MCLRIQNDGFNGDGNCLSPWLYTTNQKAFSWRSEPLPLKCRQSACTDCVLTRHSYSGTDWPLDCNLVTVAIVMTTSFTISEPLMTPSLPFMVSGCWCPFSWDVKPFCRTCDCVSDGDTSTDSALLKSCNTDWHKWPVSSVLISGELKQLQQFKVICGRFKDPRRWKELRRAVLKNIWSKPAPSHNWHKINYCMIFLFSSSSFLLTAANDDHCYEHLQKATMVAAESTYFMGVGAGSELIQSIILSTPPTKIRPVGSTCACHATTIRSHIYIYFTGKFKGHHLITPGLLTFHVWIGHLGGTRNTQEIA